MYTEYYIGRVGPSSLCKLLNMCDDLSSDHQKLDDFGQDYHVGIRDELDAIESLRMKFAVMVTDAPAKHFREFRRKVDLMRSVFCGDKDVSRWVVSLQADLDILVLGRDPQREDEEQSSKDGDAIPF